MNLTVQSKQQLTRKMFTVKTKVFESDNENGLLCGTYKNHDEHMNTLHMKTKKYDVTQGILTVFRAPPRRRHG